MRCVRFHRFGDPADVLEVEQAPTPQIGPDEVLVRIRARPINPSDLLTVVGLYGELPDLPATPGNEGMGTIEEVGADVEEPLGQRVIPVRTPGTWQEFLVVKGSNLVRVPEAVTDESAAQFVVNPLSAWVMVNEELDVRPGEWLLQTAAGSTLGRIVLQIAKIRELKTINVVRRREQVDELKVLGADEVICTEDEDLGQRVMAITDGAGVPAAIDAVGGQTGGSVIEVLARGGVLLMYGMLSLEPTPVNGGQMIFRSLRARGFWLAPWIRQAPPGKQEAVMLEVLHYMARGEIVPPVEANYDLGDVTDAVRHAQRPGRQGKVLLVG